MDLHARIDQSGWNISGAIRRLSEIHVLIESHFALEERIMREEGFSRFNEHKADHSILLDEILDIMDTLSAGDNIDLDRALGEMKAHSEWWEDKTSTEVMAEANAVLANSRVKHYGVWHPKYGWTWSYGIVFSTTSRAIAEAQRDVCVHRRLTDSELWEVCCIEEWADEQ